MPKSVLLVDAFSPPPVMLGRQEGGNVSRSPAITFSGPGPVALGVTLTHRARKLSFVRSGSFSRLGRHYRPCIRATFLTPRRPPSSKGPGSVQSAMLKSFRPLSPPRPICKTSFVLRRGRVDSVVTGPPRGLLRRRAFHNPSKKFLKPF